MRILVDINHPAHVHFFKNLIWEMQKKGHKIIITATKKDLTYELLEGYNFPYLKLGSYGQSIFSKILNLPFKSWSMYRIARKFKPDVLLGIASHRICFAARLLGKSAFVFDDTEHASLEIALYLPWATKVFTPVCFKKNLGAKQIRYNGYHELAYLHPNRFKPDPEVIAKISLPKSQNLFIIRFVAWVAAHDRGQRGLSSEDKKNIINFLEKRGKVIITSEAQLPEEYKKYQISLSPIELHSLLYYATLYIGEGGTIASEAAVLGTPAIFINSLKLGYLEEQEKKYGLLFSFTNGSEALEKIKELLAIADLKSVWQQKRQIMLKEKIDATGFIINYLENHFQ
jgi:hypothetical protein